MSFKLNSKIVVLDSNGNMILGEMPNASDSTEVNEPISNTWVSGQTYFNGDIVTYENKMCSMAYPSNLAYETMAPTEPVLWAIWHCEEM